MKNEPSVGINVPLALPVRKHYPDIMKHETVCVVDDDLVYQYTAKRILTNMPSVRDVLIFPDGERLYQYLLDHLQDEKDIPGVIFLDLNMPYMDGWTFLNLFHKLQPQIQKEVSIYVVSSSKENADLARAKGLEGVKEYIIKPISEETFKNKVEEYLQN